MAIDLEKLKTNYKVALVHDSITVPGGAEKVLYELHKLFPTAPIYTPFYRPEQFPEFKNANVIPSVLNRFRFLRHRHQLSFPFQPYAIEQFDLSEFDIVISDSSAIAKGVLTRPETLHICYCHTPMRWAWLPYLDKRASSSFIRRLAGHYLRIWDSASANRVDCWLANSKTAASRVKKFYKQDARVIYPPVSIPSLPETRDEGFYLTVGRLVEAKRPDIIVQAAAELGLKLKVVGDGPMRKELEKKVSQQDSIEFLGRVSDEERDQLYAACSAFIFASEEDAGIVPIEAMAFGKPVIAYGRGGAAETVLDGRTGVHFKEQTTDSLVNVLKSFSSSHFDSQLIRRHAEKFSAPRFQQEFTHAIITCLDRFTHGRLPGKDD